MAADQINKFIERVSNDAVFRSRLEQAAESTKNPGQMVRSVLTQTGFSFTPEEYRNATKGMMRDSALSEKEMTGITGGTLALANTTLFAPAGMLSRGSNLGRLLLKY